MKEIGNNSGERLALSHLRPQLVNLLTNALQVETDPSNTQMLLGIVNFLSLYAKSLHLFIYFLYQLLLFYLMRLLHYLLV